MTRGADRSQAPHSASQAPSPESQLVTKLSPVTGGADGSQAPHSASQVTSAVPRPAPTW